MLKRTATLVTVLALTLCGPVRAATIVWVSEWMSPGGGIPYDQGWIDLLRGEGYTVQADTTANHMVLDATNLAALEAADLIIVSRTTNSGNYATDAAEVTQWNSIETPLILFAAYTARSSRWLWINSAATTEYAAETMLEVVQADHPVFRGLSPANNQIDVIDGAVNAGQCSFITGTDVGNGTLIARRADNGNIWIAEWEAGAPFYAATTQQPADKRMLFTAGGGGGQVAGSMNFTPAGQRMFLNAVAYMVGGSAPVGAASAPSPSAGQIDVPSDAVLSWVPGPYPGTHDVYLGTVAEDVNTATRTDTKGVLASQGQTAATFDPAGLLAFGQTYYWRVDEVNAPPTSTVHRGQLWSFTAEPYAYAVSPAAATASSSFSADMVPEKTIDGSGLDALDGHSAKDPDMWLSSAADPGPVWIQYDFNEPVKLQEMWVWNSNQTLEAILGFGAREVTIECSQDGGAWTAVPGVPEFAQGTGEEGYEANTTVDLGGVLARYVKLTIRRNWSTMSLAQCGLSEVRFFAAPVRAFEPSPEVGATGVALDALLRWRPGREAAGHELYFGTDPNALVLAKTLTEREVSLASLDAGYDRTYYWRVDEVNAAASPASWTGRVWSFSTPQYRVVDDFEAYNDQCNRVYYAWKGGAGNSENTECGVPAYSGNGTGSAVGNNNAPYAEQTRIHGGRQSMPLGYDGASEATRTFSPAQNWTTAGLQVLSLFFYGASDNATGLPVWVQVADQSGKTAKVTYGAGPQEDGAALTEAAWTEWAIPLSGFVGVDPARIASITIGFGPGTGSGQLFIDDIRLYPSRDLTPPAPPVLVGHWKLDGTAQDSSGNGNNGTLTGGPTWVAAGRVGGALDLDGVDDYVDCGAGAGLDITDRLTLCAWVRPDDAGNSQHNPFVTKGDTAYAIKHNVDNTIQFYVYDGTWYTANGAVDAALFNGQWHHVAGTYDGHQLKLYIDGALAASRVHEGKISTAAYNVNIGRNSQETTRFYDGQIDDVRIYHGALSRAEVNQLLTP
ncbi:MAG: discoidin domain-containing protein [Phycisphaerae bacterium]|nr:discoidin domain-containing protein [Phycisphaerae bacterium]